MDPLSDDEYGQSHAGVPATDQGVSYQWDELPHLGGSLVLTLVPMLFGYDMIYLLGILGKCMHIICMCLHMQ